MKFREWLEMSSLRDILKSVPQSPVHHPEGDVFTHTRMVRRSMDQAIKLLKDAQKNPDSAFSNLDLSLTPEETNLLRGAAWMHDVGKSSATAWTTDTGDRLPWKSLPPDPDLPGKGWQSIGHEDPENFEPAMKDLGSTWKKMYEKISDGDKKDLWFLIQNHMKFYQGFGRLNNDMIDDEAKYKNDRRYKLLLLLVLMDRLGRGGDWGGASDSAEQTISDMQAAADEKQRAAIAQQEKRAKIDAEKEATSTPEKMVQFWADTGRPPHALPGALKGKFPHLSDDDIRGLATTF